MSAEEPQALRDLYFASGRLRMDLLTLGVKGPARALIDSALERHKPAMLNAERVINEAKKQQGGQP